MRIHRCAILLLAVCLSVAAVAQTPLRLSPERFQPFDEAFLTVYIAGLNPDTDVITVTFTGQNGPTSVEPNFVDADQIIVWVPVAITNVEGSYAVDVYVARTTGTLHYGPGTIFVAGVPPDPNPPPYLTLPEVVVGEATGSTGANVSFSVASSDGTPVVCSPASGSLFALGTTPVHCTATNANGSDSGSFLVVVTDTVPPVLTVPADIVTANPVVSFTATAVDAIDPSPEVFCFPGSGQTFPTGTTTVNCFAVDDHANFGYGSFKVTVTGGAPEITVPADITAEATSPAGAVVTFTATATEGGVITCTPPSGSTFALGTTTVTCTATNASGSDTDSFTVTVVDTTDPVIVSVHVSPDLIWPPDHRMVPVTVTVTATDLADPAPVTRIVDVTSNQPINGPGDGNTDPDWEITGPLTLNLRAERAGTSDRIYKIWLQCVDASGNATTAKAEVRVPQSRRRAAH